MGTTSILLYGGSSLYSSKLLFVFEWLFVDAKHFKIFHTFTPPNKAVGYVFLSPFCSWKKTNRKFKWIAYAQLASSGSGTRA